MSHLIGLGASEASSASIGETSPTQSEVGAVAAERTIEPVARPEAERMAGLTLALAAALAEGLVEENEQPADRPAASRSRGWSATGEAGERERDDDGAGPGPRRAPTDHLEEPQRGHGARRPGQVPADMTRDEALDAYMAALRALRRAQRSHVISESVAAAARAQADDAAATVATAQEALLKVRRTLDATLMAER